MKKKLCFITIILLLVLLINIAGCKSNINHISETSSHENQLYASLFGYFNYYYSMDLWSYREVLGDLGSIGNGSDIDYERDVSYIIGKIDSILNYNEFYLPMTEKGQGSLEHKILSKDGYLAMSLYTEAKREHLQVIKEYIIANDIKDIDSLELNYVDLGRKLESLNTSIEHLDQTMEDEYIQSINQTIELIEELVEELKKAMKSNDFIAFLLILYLNSYIPNYTSSQPIKSWS